MALLVPGRLRVIGPDGTPFESASPEARRMWSLAEEGFWRFQRDTGDLDVTPTILSFFTASVDSSTSLRDWSSLIHPDDLPRAIAQLGTLANTPGSDITIECRLRDKDGAYRWLRVRASAEHDGDRCIAFFGSARDITDRHRSERIFEQMVRQHALILNAAGEGICCIDKRGYVTFVNPAAARFFGSSVPELLGRPVCQHVDSCGYDGAAGSTHASDCPVLGPKARERGELRQSDRFRRSDDSVFDADFVVSSIDTGDSGQGAVLVFNDVTEKKAHERAVRDTRHQMAQAEKLAALGTLVSGVGHELRTPMSYINNHLYLIQKAVERIVAEDPDMEKVGQDLLRRCDSSMKGIMRMSTLLDDLRETYKPDDADFRMLDVRSVVEKAAHLFRGAYEGPVQLETQLDETGEMPIQSGRLQQVVINLLNNAAEAMPEGGTIRLITHRRGERVFVEVRDTGPGMTREIQRSIFTPFYTTKKAGSGLGLYLVKQIVDRHMGTVECETEPGRGTCFRIGLSPDAGRRLDGDATVAEIHERVRQAQKGQEATTEASTPSPSTSSSTSSPGER